MVGSLQKRMQDEIDAARLLDSQAKVEIRGHRLKLDAQTYSCISCGYSQGAFHHGSLKGARDHIRENGTNCDLPWNLESRIEAIKAQYSTPASTVVDEKPELTLSELKEDLEELHAKIDRLLLCFGIRHGR